ncbi:MAG: rhodanese-like domain-containing protein [Paracoccaceae bacterium]
MRGILLGEILLLSTGLARADETMTADDARRAALSGEVTLVDIRTPEEWAETGVPDVAHALNMKSDGFVRDLLPLYNQHPERPLAVICATGGRSGYVTEVLAQRGMTRIVNVPEGMFGAGGEPGWLARSLPVRTPEAPRTSN